MMCISKDPSLRQDDKLEYQFVNKLKLLIINPSNLLWV